LAEAEASLSDDPLSLASVLGVIGTGFARIGLYDEGRGLLDRAVTLLEPLDEADVVVDVLKRTGDLEKARNRSEAADTAYQAALALQREDHGVGSVLEGKILGALADAAVSARGAEAAEAYHTAAMDIFTTQLEAGDPQLALQRTVGARILTAQGRLEEAEREYVDVMSQQRNESGLSSGQLTVTLNNLAFVRSRMGNNAGAADSYRESLSLLESTVGASHPSTIRVRSNLSATLGRMGDMAGAEALLIDNVDAVRAESPADTTGIAGALRTLGGAYLFWGEFEKGVQVFEELLEIGVRSPGATAVVLMLDRLKLAMALTLAGRRDEGRALRESTLAALPGIGPLNSAAMGQLSWIAGRYEANGEPDLAALHREYAVPPTGARRP
jgi:tetratricopeptide (TPR) repeat protein